MNRTITVKGVGTASAAPDYTTLSMTLHTKGVTYEEALRSSSERVRRLQDAVKKAGIEKDALKTASFDVDTDYKSKKDRSGVYHQIFVGYICNQTLTVSFDFDNRLLSEILSAIADSDAVPELSIRFTVKDPDKIKTELLENAAENARRKAEILCRASGVELGTLVSIDYNWGELDVYSRTQYGLEDCAVMSNCAVPDITPDDVRASDTATFVWEIR